MFISCLHENFSCCSSVYTSSLNPHASLGYLVTCSCNMASPYPAAVIGSTGLVGSNILSQLLAARSNSASNPVYTITRRTPSASSSCLSATVETDTSKWADILSRLNPAPSVVFSGLGTTRAAGGGIQNQWKIDHDLNVELVKASRAAGADTFVFISSAGTRNFPFSRLPYSQMKNGVEDAIKDQGFKQAIIVRPGMILGQREEARMAEGLVQSMVRGLGNLSTAAQDAWGQEAEVIARAAVKAVELARQGKAPSNFWVIEGPEIIQLGRETKE
ncbi:hypothetical protein B0I35DRAFT_427355 [Stachybotrys elegans]|uniref:NAD-dependent epimerase/dehydratase domain-containing protein n=1 Tax=Stachybotrys elegans TaxID=80388 RepID=A0A8K0SSN2_9HYPO|nr:hypothetical protein B0I35DRAFT_427355 [Stachybotrys elegans]